MITQQHTSFNKHRSFILVINLTGTQPADSRRDDNTTRRSCRLVHFVAELFLSCLTPVWSDLIDILSREYFLFVLFMIKSGFHSQPPTASQIPRVFQLLCLIYNSRKGPPRCLTEGRISMTKSGLTCVYCV